MNSESTVSKDAFERLLKVTDGYPNINRYLYLYDCQRRVAAIQETTKEIGQITGEFYPVLNTEPLFGAVVDRYLLAPDMTQGRLDR